MDPVVHGVPHRRRQFAVDEFVARLRRRRHVYRVMDRRDVLFLDRRQ